MQSEKQFEELELAEDVIQAITKKEEQLPLFISEDKVQNLTIKSVVVPVTSIETIMKTVELVPEAQEAIVQKMVDADPKGYSKLSEEEAYKQIYLRLVQETVAHYLYKEGIVEGCDQYSSGFNKDNAIVFEAYYYDKGAEELAIHQYVNRRVKAQRTGKKKFYGKNAKTLNKYSHLYKGGAR